MDRTDIQVIRGENNILILPSTQQMENSYEMDQKSQSKSRKKTIWSVIQCMILLTILLNLASCGENIKTDSISIKQLNEHIWLMDDNGEATGYLVVGSEKAAVIDTMNGSSDVKELVRTITSLPIVVINTHGHCDHISGDGYFGEAYINKRDWSLAQEAFGYTSYRQIQRMYDLPTVNLLEVNEGDSFDLGEITLEVYEIPGHTPGGICLLDRKDRILFTGDSINRHCWMQLPCCSSLVDFYLALSELQPIRNDYDYILHGHATDFEPASLYEEMMAAVKEVADGVHDGDSDYEYFGGLCRQHQFPSGNGVIVYNE